MHAVYGGALIQVLRRLMRLTTCTLMRLTTCTLMRLILSLDHLGALGSSMWGLQEAYITVMPGVVTTTPCTNKSVSPGCPGYTPPAPRNPIAGGTHSDHDAYHGHEHHDAYHAHHLHHHQHDKATTFMTGHGIIFYT